MEKGTFVKDISPGQKVNGVFCAASKDLRLTRAGIPYLAFSVMDTSGSMEARLWDNADRAASLFETGDYIRVEAEAQEYNGQCQLKVNRIDPVSEEDVNPEDFIPVTGIDRNAAWEFTQKSIRGIASMSLHAILEALFSQPAIVKGFKNAPAARKMHHACIGGLMEHSLSVLMLCRRIASLYPHLDYDLLTAASICHDLGKIKEFSWQRMPIDYTTEGRLLGHISMGMEMITAAARIAGVKEDDQGFLMLRHLVLSHHGRLEFGSPVLPMTEEAMVFHMMDDLDAKINYLGGLRDQIGLEPDEQDDVWSPYQRLFERFFLLSGRKTINPAMELRRYIRERMNRRPAERDDSGQDTGDEIDLDSHRQPTLF